MPSSRAIAAPLPMGEGRSSRFSFYPVCQLRPTNLGDDVRDLFPGTIAGGRMEGAMLGGAVDRAQPILVPIGREGKLAYREKKKYAPALIQKKLIKQGLAEKNTLININFPDGEKSKRVAFLCPAGKKRLVKLSRSPRRVDPKGAPVFLDWAATGDQQCGGTKPGRRPLICSPGGYITVTAAGILNLTDYKARWKNCAPAFKAIL